MNLFEKTTRSSMHKVPFKPSYTFTFVPMAAFIVFSALSAMASPDLWQQEWPNTNFGQSLVPFEEILSGGPPKDGIPSIDDPQFTPISSVEELAEREPVIGLSIDGDARAYPLRILTWHEIVNDVVGGVPIAVTYCPLCNTAIVFDRRVRDRTLEFGTTGKLRHSDLIMYDRQTESWWQQFGGDAIVGSMVGERLQMLPARLESFARFKARFPNGRVLRSPQTERRPYGRNPYVGYDTATAPFLYTGPVSDKVPAMLYVVAVGREGWALTLLRREGRIDTGELVLTWSAGSSSALDTARISGGRDIGNVTVQRRGPDGSLEDIPYKLTFAFAFYAFQHKARLYTIDGPILWERKE